MEMHVRRFHMLHVALEGDSIYVAPNIVDGSLSVSRGTIPIPRSRWHVQLEVPVAKRKRIYPGSLAMFSQRLWKAYEDARMKQFITACETVLHIGSPPSININLGSSSDLIGYADSQRETFKAGVEEAVEVLDLGTYNITLVAPSL